MTSVQVHPFRSILSFEFRNYSLLKQVYYLPKEERPNPLMYQQK